MLDAKQNLSELRQPGMFRGRPCDPHKGVQLVYRAVCFDPQRVLGDALPAGQTRVSAVTAAGVDAIDGHPWIVESVFHRSSYLGALRNSSGVSARRVNRETAIAPL